MNQCEHCAKGDQEAMERTIARMASEHYDPDPFSEAMATAAALGAALARFENALDKLRAEERER